MLAVKNLTRRKIRSTLTVLGVAVGIASVVSLMAVARGLRKQFNEFFAVGDAHLVLTRAGAADPFISYLPDDLIERLEANDLVAAAYPFLFAAHQIPGQTFFFFYGAAEGSPFLDELRTIDGRSLFDEANPQRRICLGRTVAGHLGKGVGSTLMLGNEEFEVVGVFESSTPLLQSGGLLAIDDAQRVAGLKGNMSLVQIRLRDFHPEMLAQAETELEAAFPEVEATAPAVFTDAFDEFDLAEQGVAVFSLLAVIVGGIVVMNTMLMSVFERTREIGILRAVGWSKGMILRQVVAEALIVGGLGGPVGIALGVGMIEAMGLFGELSWITGDYGWSLLTIAMAVAVGMVLVGAAYPALRAVRITPIEALRYE
ncbi:MAG: ABC transporter permease [Planctomycetota bacterium]|jgi:ABC-type lipoprotein release transport system permease subunit